MRTLHVDIETYSSEPIKTAGLYRYVEAEDFAILLIAYSIDGGPVALVDLTQARGVLTYAEIQTFFGWLSNPDVQVHAYNAAFEWWCLTTWAERSGWPLDRWELLRRMRCTMVHGLYCGYPAGLEAIGHAMGLPEDKQKLATGRALIRTFCQPHDGRRTLPRHEPERWELFKEYCKQDVVTEMAVAARLKSFPLPQIEQQRWQRDQIINARGMRVDRQLVDAALAVDAAATGELQAEATTISGLDNPKSVQQLTGWLAGQGVDTADLRKETVEDLLGGGLDAGSRRMLEIRQELAKTSTRKYAAIKACVGLDDRVRGLFQFYGTRTGRWAGRLVQVHNLPQNHLPALDAARELVRRQDVDALRLVYGAVPDVLSQLIRTAFVPSEGRRFLVADFAAIEARIIAALAGETWRQEVLAQGGDIYCASASKMFKVPVEKHGVNSHLRQKGKIAELALGYQGSTGALISMGALKMGLTEEELPEIVAAWRKANSRIVGLWYHMEEAATQTVLSGHPHTVAGRITLRLAAGHGDKVYLLMQLPSGRCLYYPRPRIGPNRKGRDSLLFMGVDQTTKKWGLQETYGGKLVENAVQAIARDCLAETIDRLEARGYQIVMHVHDEVIIEATPEQRLEDVVAVMGEPMPWMPDLLLRGDGFEATYYKKD